MPSDASSQMHSQADASALFSPQDWWLCTPSFGTGFHLAKFITVHLHVLGVWAHALSVCLSVCLSIFVHIMHACMHTRLLLRMQCLRLLCTFHSILQP